MSAQTEIHVAPDGKVCCLDPDDEIRARFTDVKADMQRRADREIQNADVLSTLLDLFWIYHENEEVPP